VASTKLKSIARRMAKLEEALSPRWEPDRWRGRRWRSGAASGPSLQVRFGHLRRLPGDYQGERHIEITHCLPDQKGQKWVEFSEVPGPPPNPAPQAPGLARYLDVVFVPPKPSATMPAPATQLAHLPDTRADGDLP
jgi:hypothetical protein